MVLIKEPFKVKEEKQYCMSVLYENKNNIKHIFNV